LHAGSIPARASRFSGSLPEPIATALTPSSVNRSSSGCSSHSGEGRRKPFDAAVGEAAHDGELVLVELAALDHQVHVGPARLFEPAHQQLAEIGGRGVGVEQRDARLVGPREPPRGGVRLVVELANRGEDRLAGFLAHAGFAVDHAADGHRRAARGARHVGDRRRALGPATGPAPPCWSDFVIRLP
jgi:hypothetical protein